MNISSLIELAKDAAGSYGELAERIGRPASRISDWKAGRRKPDAADIMLLAEVAGRPVFETLAEIEMELDTERSSVWQRALGNLRAAGVAATVVLGATAVVSLTSKPADAAVELINCCRSRPPILVTDQAKKRRSPRQAPAPHCY